MTCSVSGYDVAIVNEGDAVVDEGTSVVWSVPFARTEGEHVLLTPLDPSVSRLLPGALGSNYLAPDVPCEIIRDEAE